MKVTSCLDVFHEFHNLFVSVLHAACYNSFLSSTQKELTLVEFPWSCLSKQDLLYYRFGITALNFIRLNVTIKGFSLCDVAALNIDKIITDCITN